MKFLLLASFLALGLAKTIPNQSNKLVEYITQYGYPAESSSVTTEDGYILQLVRIPHGIQGNKLQMQSQNKNVQRPAVVLMHGLMSSAEDFVYGGPSQGLAFHLAEHGYDVYLGNARGSLYGQQHTTLNPAKDAAFWRYCFDQIGQKDLPAIVNKVLSISQQDKVTFIGHAEGATAFLILLAEQPQYADKFERAVTLGPIAYLKRQSHPILNQIVNNHKSQSWIIKNLGVNTFRPSNEIVSTLQEQCYQVLPVNQQQVCKNVYFLFNGYNSQNLNQTTVSEVLHRVPSGGSVREVLHYAQLAASGRFESFEYEPTRKLESHEYDLSHVTIPVAVFYTPNDVLAAENDVQTLIGRIPNVVHQKVYDSYTNNLDLLYGNNVVSVYDDLVEVLHQQERNQRRNTRLDN